MRQILDLISIITQAEKDISEIKNKQIVGTTDISIVESKSSAQWDINQDVLLSTTSRAIFFYFIADTQPAPFAEFRIDFQLNNVAYDTLNDTRLNGIPFGLDQVILNTLNFTTDQLSRFAYDRYTISNPTFPVTINVKAKVRVLSTDTGTIGAFVE